MSINPACLPRIVKVNTACGCTLTRATITGMTPAEFEALQTKETEHLAKVVASATEAKIIGVQESGFATLLKSAIKDAKPSLSFSKVGTQSLINPYIMRPQRSVVNANYWVVESGVATSGRGANGIPANAWDIVVNTGVSPWRSPIQGLHRYFLPGKSVIIMTLDNTTDKNAQTLLYKIHASVDATSGGVQKARITLIPNVATTAWATMSAPNKALYEVTMGVVQTGANSVHGYEEWCFNSPSENPIKLIVNWLQWSRNSRCVDDEYKKTLDAVMSGKVNSFMQKFSGYIPLVEQNRQAAMLEESDWLRSLWYGRKLVGQDPNNIDLNELRVFDPEDSSCLLGYKAQASGVQELLEDCGRVIDMNGGQLDLDFLFEQLYYVRRHRSADGDRGSVIDIMTNRFTRTKIRQIMIKRLKAMYGVDSNVYFKVGEKITHEGMTMFEYDLYDVEEHGYQIAVFSDEFFDDHISAFPNGANGTTDIRSRGRQLWVIDWSDIAPAIAGKRTVTRKNPDPNTSALYKCRMDANIREYRLDETIWTVMVDRPHRHLLIHNFSDACPKLTVAGCDLFSPPAPGGE